MANFFKNVVADQVLGGAGHGLGVRDYFSGFNAPTQVNTPTRDEGWSNTPVGTGSSAGLDIYGSGSQPVARDLKTNPLTMNEAKYGLPLAQNLIGALPFGSFANQAIDYNLGEMSTDRSLSTEMGGLLNRDSLGFKAGVYNSVDPNASLADSMKFAVEQKGREVSDAARDFFFGKPAVDVRDIGPNATYASEFMRRIAGAEAVDAPETVESVHSSGGGNYNQNGWGSSGDPEAAAAGDTAGYGYTGTATSGGYNTGVGSYGGSMWGGGNGGNGAHSGWADGGAVQLADGGQVGLTGPMYGDVNQAPASLAQMGFASGGGVGLGAPGGSTGPQQIQERVAMMVRDPGFAQIAQRAVGAAMQSGELTPEELITLGRIAEAAAHNPALYPQLRQFAMQNGMTPLPDAFDPQLAMVLIAASKIMGRTQPGQVPPTDVAQMQNPNGMSNGGFLQGPGTGRSDSIGTVEQTTGKPVKVANGEYVIPKHVVDAKGKDFFDKMLRQYAQITPQE